VRGKKATGMKTQRNKFQDVVVRIRKVFSFTHGVAKIKDKEARKLIII